MSIRTIFIGGSRTGTDFGKLPQAVGSEIDKIIEAQSNVLVGDANGVDKAVQVYLAGKNYRHVTVYVSGAEQIRNLADASWRVERTGEGTELQGRELRELKDVEMANRADIGLMVWDDIYQNRFGNIAVSKGTLSNIINLLNLNKRTNVFYKPEKAMYNLSTIKDFEAILLPKTDNKTQVYYKKLRDKASNGSNDPQALSLFEI